MEQKEITSMVHSFVIHWRQIDNHYNIEGQEHIDADAHTVIMEDLCNQIVHRITQLGFDLRLWMHHAIETEFDFHGSIGESTPKRYVDSFNQLKGRIRASLEM